MRNSTDIPTSSIADNNHSHEHAHESYESHKCCAAAHQAVPASAPDLMLSGRTFSVIGLDCAEEVAVLKSALEPFLGTAEQLSFDILNGRLTVATDAASLSDAQVVAAINNTGMRAERWEVGQAPSIQSQDNRKKQNILAILSGLSVIAGFGLHTLTAGSLGEAFRQLADHSGQSVPVPEVIAYSLAIIFGGRYVVVKAWYAARRLRPDMNLLMVIAVTGAIGINQWFEAAVVTFLFALSLVLESWSVARARRAVAALMDLSPSSARLRSDSGQEREVLVEEVAVGSLFIVRAGERIALDGVVRTGSSAVNQAPITGESVPVEKIPGDEVFSGTINGDGVLEVASSKAAADTTLSRIIRMVEQAHSRRAQAEQWVEKFAAVYTPTVIVLALLVLLVPPLLLGGQWQEWIYRALVLLVIACPCALVISTPVSIVAALASAARRGVLVKGGTYIEQPAHLGAMAFDKTGTLTCGTPEVVHIMPLNDHSEDDLMSRAAALEADSNHPLAKAIMENSRQRGLTPHVAREVQVIQGKGVIGRIEGQTFWLGSSRFVRERGQGDAQILAAAAAMEHEGRTVIVIGNDTHVCGLVAVADPVRPESKAVIRQLRERGIKHIVLLSGDNQLTAEAIARQVGIDEVYGELLPDDKVAAIESLVEKYNVVAMVGDGVNDAPAMARASLGIAMGAAGSDAAIETADIALMTDDLAKLPWLIIHSQRTLGVIRQNIGFSLGVKLLFAGLTFAGLASLWGAIAADVGASLLVVANGLRLLSATEISAED